MTKPVACYKIEQLENMKDAENEVHVISQSSTRSVKLQIMLSMS